jgi:hypothetical protein
MIRAILSGMGTVVAAGFLAASATANYLFGASLGRSDWEGCLYGAVGVLAVAMNALAPFYLSWALAETRRAKAAGIGCLWLLCLAYSTSSALGFATQNREGTAFAQQVSHDAYEDTRRELLDLETRRSISSKKDKARLDGKIDAVRKRLDQARDDKPMVVDAQAQFLSGLTRGVLEPRHVRAALSALFALMVEVGATLGLFAALPHLPPKSPPVPERVEARATSRWTPKASA